MTASVRKAGMPWPMRSQGTLAMLATMSAPTMISAGPTAYGGMLAARVGWVGGGEVSW
jgi:hypothetical protein